MKHLNIKLVSLVLMSFCCSIIGFAQIVRPDSPEVSTLYLISAKAGRINASEGEVSIKKSPGKTGTLMPNETLEAGDLVSTGKNGKVEILLNPGSYLRLGANSEFEFLTTELEDLQLKINKGSGILEIITHEDTGFIVGVQTPQTKAYILKQGLYRVDVSEINGTQISVSKGKIQIGESKATTLKSGKSITINKDQQNTAKYTRFENDELEMWSTKRSKELVALNARLNQNLLANSLIGNLGAWSIYNSFGIWVFDPGLRTWCFLPFGSRWSSPYGSRYYQSIWSCPIPLNVIYGNHYSTPPTNSGSGNGNGNSSSQAVQQDRRLPNSVPPFQKMNGGRSETPWYSSGNDSSSGGSDSPSAPSYPENKPSAPSFPDVKPSAPAPPPPPPPAVSNPKNGKDN